MLSEKTPFCVKTSPFSSVQIQLRCDRRDSLISHRYSQQFLYFLWKRHKKRTSESCEAINLNSRQLHTHIFHYFQYFQYFHSLLNFLNAQLDFNSQKRGKVVEKYGKELFRFNEKTFFLHKNFWFILLRFVRIQSFFFFFYFYFITHKLKTF